MSSWQATRLVAGTFILLSLALGVAGVGWGRGLLAALLCLAVALAAAAAVLVLAHRRLGGYTGDVLGAAGVIVETFALLVLVAHRA